MTSFVILLAAWLAPRQEGGLGIVFIGVPAWAVFVPSVITLFGELVKRRGPDAG